MNLMFHLFLKNQMFHLSHLFLMNLSFLKYHLYRLNLMFHLSHLFLKNQMFR